MREILFRGKQTSDGKWVYGFYIENETFGNTLIPSIIPIDENGAARFDDDGYNIEIYVIPETVGQYTGLSDKNGVKIFENDIVRYGKKNWVVNWNDETFRWEISLKDGCYQYPIYDGQGYPKYVDRITLGWVAAEFQLSGQLSVEVIGNKFDNPELIERDNNEKDWIF